MLNRLSLRFVLGLAAGAALALPGSALAAPSSAVVGHVYLNDNPAGPNTIAGFARHADGSLTSLPGSPFAAGGTGAGQGLGSQGALQLADHGRYLLAVDAGSNQISVLRVRRNGSLRPVSGPVSSGGVDPVSIAVSGSLVYVANGGPGSSNYTGFSLNRGGHLRPLPGSTVAIPDGSGPGDILFSGDGTRLVGVRVTPSLIDSFRVDGHGRLHAASGSPFPAQGLGPFGSAFRPTNPAQLFVTNAHNGTGLGTVSAFTDSSDGTLSAIAGSPFADGQTAPCWLVISHDGRHLYAVNTGSGSVSSYAIAADGALTSLGSTPVKASGGVGATDAGLSPDDRWLYVNESKADAVAAFSVNGSSLTELSSSPTPLPVGASPAGIAVS